MRIKMLVSAFTAAILSIGLATAPGAQGAAKLAVANSRIDVWTWNMTGAGSDPDAVNNGGHEDALAPVVNQLNALSAGARPDVITLQEVCQNQADHLIAYLDNLQYAVNFRPIRTQERCDNRVPGASHALGDLIAVPKAYGPQVANYDINAGQGLTCFLFTKGKTIVACSTQVSGSEDVRRSVTYRMLQDQIKPWTSFGYGVVVAGDFNTSPSNPPMDNMYDESVPGARGRLFEASMTCGTCRDGAWTHDSRGSLGLRKIDYVFFSKNVFARSSFQVDLDLKEKYSYHRFYKASSTFR